MADEETFVVVVGVDEPHGDVIGIVAARIGEGSSCHILPIRAAEKVRSDITRFGELRPGWVGVEVEDAPDAVEGSVARVVDMKPETPAAKSGLLKGDILLGIDNNVGGDLGDALSDVVVTDADADGLSLTEEAVFGTDPELAEVQAATAGIPTQPMLYLHGRNDGCIGAEVAESARAMVTANVSIDVIDECGHFLQLERPDVVNRRVMEFLS